MKATKLLVGTLMVSASALALPSFADVYIRQAPPPPRAEQFEPRDGQAWVPGVWQWNHGKHEWVSGHYVAERKGYRYERDRWVQHDNKQWAYQRGGWAQDSDGDGTPDRLDRYPNNPNRK
jgi:hypothetical protein